MDTPKEPTTFKITGGTVVTRQDAATTIISHGPPDWYSLKERGGPWPEMMEVVDKIAPEREDHAPWGRIPAADYAAVTAALFRDAAVRWLMDKWFYGVEVVKRHDGYDVRCAELDQGSGPTLDRALFAAVDAVLTAEGK